jgi:acyl-coenzyme A thioesterase PaaI-like protein
MVTGRLNIRFRRPIPPGETLTIVGEVVSWKKRTLEARGEIRLADGQVGAEATGTFLEIPAEKVEGMKEALAFWQVVPD